MKQGQDRRRVQPQRAGELRRRAERPLRPRGIIGGSPKTRSVCTVMASDGAVAVVMLPRTAGSGTVVSLNSSAASGTWPLHALKLDQPGREQRQHEDEAEHGERSAGGPGCRGVSVLRRAQAGRRLPPAARCYRALGAARQPAAAPAVPWPARSCAARPCAASPCAARPGAARRGAARRGPGTRPAPGPRTARAGTAAHGRPAGRDPAGPSCPSGWSRRVPGGTGNGRTVTGCAIIRCVLQVKETESAAARRRPSRSARCAITRPAESSGDLLLQHLLLLREGGLRLLQVGDRERASGERRVNHQQADQAAAEQPQDEQDERHPRRRGPATGRLPRGRGPRRPAPGHPAAAALAPPAAAWAVPSRPAGPRRPAALRLAGPAALGWPDAAPVRACSAQSRSSADIPPCRIRAAGPHAGPARHGLAGRHAAARTRSAARSRAGAARGLASSSCSAGRSAPLVSRRNCGRLQRYGQAGRRGVGRTLGQGPLDRPVLQ